MLLLSWINMSPNKAGKMRLKRQRTKVLLIAVSAEICQIPITKRATDFTNTLSQSELELIESRLTNLESKKGSQVVVLIVYTTGDYTIEEYAIKIAHDKNRLGREGVDDGVLLLVAKNDRKLRIEVGYGLEGAIPDVYAKRIIEEFITPSFKQGDFFINQILPM